MIVDPYETVHNPECLDIGQHDPSKTQCRLDARQFQGTYLPCVRPAGAPPKTLAPSAPAEPVTLPALTHTNATISAYATTARERELQDRAVIGMAAMVELIDTHRTARQAAAITDPEAMANEALDMIQVMSGAAKTERERILQRIRVTAGDWAVQGQKHTSQALLDLANAIQYDLGSNS